MISTEESTSEQSKDSTQYPQNSLFYLELNCYGTQFMWPERWYLTSQCDDADVLGVRLLHKRQPGK